MGYTPYYTAAVWTGYDRQERLSSHLGNPSTTLWRQVMSEVHKTLPYKEFAQPDASSLKTVTYCLSSGMLPGPACGGHLATGTFFAEDVPTGTCTYHKVQKPADTNGSNGSDGNGSSTDPGDNTTDPGTDPGGGTTDPGGGTTPETPPAEGGGTETTPRRRRMEAAG